MFSFATYVQTIGDHFGCPGRAAVALPVTLLRWARL